MKLIKVMVVSRLARSRSEGERLIKQGAVQVGGCDPDCTFFTTGKCTCGGWTKIVNPVEDINPRTCVKVGMGFVRTVTRIDGTSGVDQLPGVARVPHESPPEPSS
jgi:hypothetical protein